MNDEPKKMINVRSLSAELPDNRMVVLGWNTDDPEDSSYYIHFINSGVEMKFKVSPEALSALIELKPSVDLYRNTGAMFQWRLVDPKAVESAALDA